MQVLTVAGGTCLGVVLHCAGIAARVEAFSRLGSLLAAIAPGSGAI